MAYTGSVPLSPEREAMKRATYEDVLNAPENKVAEILDGPFDGGRGGPGGWLLLDEPELHFGEHVVVPDLAGWRRVRLPSVPDAPWLDLAPDWVVRAEPFEAIELELGELWPDAAAG
jgi:hypothetical protein